MKVKFFIAVAVLCSVVGCSDSKKDASATGLTESTTVGKDAKQLKNGGKSLSQLDSINGVRIVNGINKVSSKDGVTVHGWAVDEKTQSLASAVYLVIDDKEFPATYGAPRADVASALGGAKYTNSGFTAGVTVDKIGAGQHKLSVKVIGSDGITFYTQAEKVDLIIE